MTRIWDEVVARRIGMGRVGEGSAGHASCWIVYFKSLNLECVREMKHAKTCIQVNIPMKHRVQLDSHSFRLDIIAHNVEAAVVES